MVYSALHYTDLTKTFLSFTTYYSFTVNAIHINMKSIDFHLSVFTKLTNGR